MPDERSLPPVRVALIGMGKMGHAIADLAISRGCEIVAQLDAHAMSQRLTPDALGKAQVAIDFTVPHAAVDNAVNCLRAGCPVVIGTTGWSDEKDRLASAVREYNCAALWSPNFSLGVQLFLAALEQFGSQLASVSAFDIRVVETHHSAKKDAPSGTAIVISEAIGRKVGTDPPITSVRVGSVPGTHEVIVDAPFEQIRLTHEARDRRVFADGALTAAKWLASASEPAVYTMRDILSANPK